MADITKDVAEMRGISTAAASSVINDQPYVSPKTRGKAPQAIDQSGYKPDAIARDSTGVIELVIPESVQRLFSDPFFAPLLSSLMETGRHLGYELTFSLLPEAEDAKNFFSRALSSSLFDGLLIASARIEAPLFRYLHEGDTTFLSIGRLPVDEVPYVTVDNYGGARRATEHLIEQGHQAIATISGPLNQTAGTDRLQGYKDALREAGLTVNQELIIPGDFTERSGVGGCGKFSKPTPPLSLPPETVLL